MAIYVDTREASKEQVDKINKILDKKFHGYHAPAALLAHTRSYGILVIYIDSSAHSTRTVPKGMLSLPQFFRKYETKRISFKEVICRN